MESGLYALLLSYLFPMLALKNAQGWGTEHL
jgi:hypothetical protein